MRLPQYLRPVVALTLVATVAACEQEATAPDVELAPVYAKVSQSGAEFGPTDAITAFVDQVNAGFAAGGSTVRLDYPWLFTVGGGTDPFQALRTGSRWTTATPVYVLDPPDYTTDIPADEVDAALVSAYETWNAAPQSGLTAVRGADLGGNLDLLDGIYDGAGKCLFFVDLFASNLISFDFDTGAIEFEPEADIVVGGWPPASYFEDCLGSDGIIAVTWTFSDVDADGDQYRDRLYVEQYYNPAFLWVTSGSVYLDFPLDFGADLETIALHENGHAHGLGHFGGPLLRQVFRVRGHLERVFTPEAAMNPFYLGGEARSLYPTDEAALKTMYARIN